jgi:hypothetical protein
MDASLTSGDTDPIPFAAVSEPSNQGGVGAAPVPALALPKFCTKCGASWQEGWMECARCAARQVVPIARIEDLQPVSITPALSLYFALLVASGIGMVVGLSGVRGANLVLGITAAHTLIIIIWSIALRREVLPSLVKRFHPLWLLAALGGALVTFMAAVSSLEVLHRAVGMQKLGMTREFFHAGYGWPMVVLACCVQPAIFEELGFRGVVFSALNRILAGPETVFVSALLFMTLHLMIGSFPHLFLMGLALGYLRWRTGSLLPGMVLHFTHNLLCVLSEPAMRGFWN